MSSRFVFTQLVLCSRVGLFPFPWGQFLGLWQLTSWLQSDHHVVNFFHLVGDLPDSSQDVAQNIIYSPWGGSKGPWLCLMTKLDYLVLLNCVPLLLHFLTSLIKLILWLEFFHKGQTEDVENRAHRVLLCFNFIMKTQPLHCSAPIKQGKNV